MLSQHFLIIKSLSTLCYFVFKQSADMVDLSAYMIWCSAKITKYDFKTDQYMSWRASLAPELLSMKEYANWVNAYQIG